jgi:hypothetical protein
MPQGKLRFLVASVLWLLVALTFDTVAGFRALGDDDEEFSEILAVPCVARLSQCPPQGCGGDPQLDLLKNINYPADSPDDTWNIGYIVGLNDVSPRRWVSGSPRDSLAAIYEGSQVQITAYLISAHVTSTPESTNCYLTGTTNNDYHLNLVDDPSLGLSSSVVAEITPRYRLRGWTLTKLRRIASHAMYVRVTGWLLFDSQHANFPPATRATAWEIHPVTYFEICNGRVQDCDAGVGWVPLESF